MNQITRDDTLAFTDEAEARAKATDCGVTGCDRSTHVSVDAPEDWNHRLDWTHGPLIGWELIRESDGRVHSWIMPTLPDEGIELDGDGVRALAASLEGLRSRLLEHAEDVDRRSLPSQRVDAVARNVRGRLAVIGDSMRLSAKPLTEILEVSEKRARDLYQARAAFTLDELGLLSAYFHCDLQAWMTEDGPRWRGAFDLAAAEDRLVTARESVDA